MLDLQAVEQRANARAAATPANPANRLIGERDASAQRISQLATLAGVAGDDAIGDEARNTDASISQLATLAGVAGDERITCGQCLNFDRERLRCDNHRRAGLRSPWLGLDLPTLPQRCSGFAAGPSCGFPIAGSSGPDVSLFHDPL